jgi:hypothetical protein
MGGREGGQAGGRVDTDRREHLQDGDKIHEYRRIPLPSFRPAKYLFNRSVLAKIVFLSIRFGETKF